MQVPALAPQAGLPTRKADHITCLSDCGYSGHLIYPSLWVWPTLGIILALAWVAFRLLRKRRRRARAE